jgi:Fe2+ transport system protein FeoA
LLADFVYDINARLAERMTLDRVGPKERCRVIDVRGLDGISQRLMEMGLIEGALLEVVRCAPLGDPMEIRVGGYRLLLRKADASAIEVEVCR